VDVRTRRFGIGVYSVNKIVVWKWEILVVCNGDGFTRLPVVTLDRPLRSGLVTMYYEPEHFSEYRVDELQTRVEAGVILIQYIMWHLVA